MTTVSFKEFSKGQPVRVVGNEANPQTKQALVEKNPGYISRVKEGVKERLSEALDSEKQSIAGTKNPVSAGLNIAKNLTGAAVAPIMELPGVKQVGEAFGKAGQAIVDTKIGNKVTDILADKVKPGVLEGASDVLETGANMFALEGLKVGGIKGKGGAIKVIDKAKEVTENVTKKGKQIKQNLLEENADSRLKTTAERTEKPSAKYDKFIEQEKKAKVDVKADSSLSQVGEKIGENFERVVDKRKESGSKMGEELQKIGGNKVNVSKAVKKFSDEVTKEGLDYDVDTRTFTSKGQSKMTNTDKSILSEFASELEKLGTGEVTVKDLDAFVSRVNKDLDLYKSKNNIIGSTNAERIIKKTLNDFKSNFDQFKEYSTARKEYADLSDFLEEGQSYLGKKTQAGDFAKDASIAKSSVQSLLNSGKKDWLARLEDLTGYSALDDSVIALQAMKDMGNPKGASLLQLISEGDIPTTKAGILNQILSKVWDTAREKTLGTPEEQTRAFLKSIESNGH